MSKQTILARTRTLYQEHGAPAWLRVARLQLRLAQTFCAHVCNDGPP